MIDLAEVKVGDEKGFLGFPENRLLRIQTKQLIQNLDIHTSAPYFPGKNAKIQVKWWQDISRNDSYSAALWLRPRSCRKCLFPLSLPF
jgi:hypothetical protein